MNSRPRTSVLTPMDINTPNKSKRWQCGDQSEYISTLPGIKGDPLDNIYQRMKLYDVGKCDAWRDEIEKLLIFASLFSAVVTAFTLDSYKLLQENTQSILGHISLQLDAIANNSTPLPPSIAKPSSSFAPAPRSVRINIFWFMALTLSLSAVIFGVLCLQWLREFRRDKSLPPKDAVPIRQLCYDGLYTWRVPEMISSLSVLLQISVLLFFAGVLDLLWSLHHVVAVVITALIGLMVTALVFFTLAPAVQAVSGRSDSAWCPYKSPLSLAVFAIVIAIKQAVKRLFTIATQFSRPSLRAIPTSWAVIERMYHEHGSEDIGGNEKFNITGLAQALKWTVEKMRPELNQEVALDIFHSLHSSLPLEAKSETMHRWAKTLMRGKEYVGNELEAALGLKESTSGSRYELLMAGFLRTCFPNNGMQKRLLLELQVRCLNTLGHGSGIPVALLPFPLKDSPDDREMLFQVLATTLDHANLNHDQDREILFRVIEPNLRYIKSRIDDRLGDDHQLCIGRALGRYIRFTPVKKNNVQCASILTQLKSLLDHIYRRSNEEYWIRFAAFLLHDLDLRMVERWGTDIQLISSNAIPAILELVPFMEDILLPALKRPELNLQPVYPSRAIHGQLRSFYESLPYSHSVYQGKNGS